MAYALKAALCAALSLPAAGFVSPSAQPASPQSLRASSGVAAAEGGAAAGKGPRIGAAAGLACGLAAAASLAALKRRRPSKTAARYTTQVILPALQWIKTGLKVSDLQATELKAKNLAGVDVLVGKDGSGKLFCVGNLCPHIGTPMSEGADVIGDVIVCPLHGSSFKVTTGELIDWCPSPPIIGPLTGLPVEKKNLAVFDVRSSFFGGDIEVLVDTNAKKAWEADYWKGLTEPILCKFASTGSRDKGYGKGGGCKGKPPPPNVAVTPNMPAATGFHANGSVPPPVVAPPTSKTNVWIGDLPPAFTQEECQRIFAAYGTIVQCRVTPPQPGRNASALVRFSIPEEAAWIVENLNGNLAEGLDRPIIVKFANEPRSQQVPPVAQAPPGQAAPVWGPDRSQPYPGGAGMKGAGKGGKNGKGCGENATCSFQALYGAVKGAGLLGGGQHMPLECQLHVRNLPSDTTDMDLLRLFSPFGALAPMKSLAMLNPDGSCKGVGFIDFVDASSAQAAASSLDNFVLPDGSMLGVTQKKPSKKGGKGEFGKGEFGKGEFGKGEFGKGEFGKGGGSGGSWSGFAEGPNSM